MKRSGKKKEYWRSGWMQTAAETEYQKLKEIEFRWMERDESVSHNRLVDPVNRLLEHMLPFAMTPETAVGRGDGAFSVYRTPDRMQVTAVENATGQEYPMLMDHYTDSTDFRPWSAKKRDSEKLKRAYRLIADQWAEELFELTGIQVRASQISRDQFGSLRADFLASTGGVNAEQVKRVAVDAAEIEVAECRNRVFRMIYNVGYEYSKKVTVGDLGRPSKSFEDRLVAAWCRAMRLKQKYYKTASEDLNDSSRFIKLMVIDAVREAGSFLVAQRNDLLIDPEFADAPYDGARSQSYMTMATRSVRMLMESLRVLEEVKARPAAELKQQAIMDAVEKAAGYWKKSCDRCGETLEFDGYGESPDNMTMKLKRSFFCQDRLCALCSWRRSLKAGHRLERALECLHESGEAYEYVFLTLTVPNVSGDRLRPMFDHMHEAWNKLTKEAWFKNAVAGWYRSDEVTHTTDAHLIKEGLVWHPHIHVVIACKPGYYTNGIFMEQDTIRRVWHHHMSLWCDAQQVDIRKIRPKNRAERRQEERGDADAMRRVGDDVHAAVVETTKYVCKSSDYLVRSRTETARRVEVLHEALLGLRMTEGGGVIAEALKAVDAEEKIDESDLVCVKGEDESRADTPDFEITACWMEKLGGYVVVSVVKVPRRVSWAENIIAFPEPRSGGDKQMRLPV